ncbi:MAG: hypothetical protein ACOY3M_05155 [Patescibacteria group bacterium]
MQKNSGHSLAPNRDRESPSGFFSRWSLLLIAAALFLVLTPLMRSGFFITDDGEWMIIRLSAFYQSLADGQFPVRFLGRLNNSYGYPVSNFLYPGFLYLGSLLHILGASFQDAVKIILAGSVVSAVIAVYAGLRKTYGRWARTMGAVSLVFAPYLLFDMYHRGSVGEVLAIAAASWAVTAIVRGWGWLFAPMIGLLIISHNSAALLLGIAIATLAMSVPARGMFLTAGAIGVGFASFFWIPALLEKHLVRFDAVVISDPSSYFITPLNAGLIGLGTVVALAVFLGLRKKITRFESVAFFWAIAGIILALPITAPVWNISAFSVLFQFPYRALLLPVLFGPWIIAAVFEHLSGWRRVALSAVLFSVWLSTASVLLGEVSPVRRDTGYYVTNEATTTVANEYMPRWVHDIPVNRPVETLEVINGDALLSTRTFSGEKITFTAEAKESSTIQINKIYYPGWGITVDNRLTPIDYANRLGVMRIEIPKGTHVVSADFRETPFRLAADLISILSFICYCIVLRRLTHSS